MKTYQITLTSHDDFKKIPKEVRGWDSRKTLVLAFFSKESSETLALLKDLSSFFKSSIVMGCSTSGDILHTKILDIGVSVTIILFQSSSIKVSSQKINDNNDSYRAGNAISASLNDESLKGVFVLSDGLKTNGTELALGLNSVFEPGKVSISGGLAGDGPRFKKTVVFLNGHLHTDMVVGVGFYGKDLLISTSTQAGWDVFGLERTITKSKNNILYEIDGKPALELYKKYLGEESKNLPESGLLFPLQIRKNQNDKARLIRTILNVNENDHSMVFAGNIPVGWQAQLMRANFDHLIGAAHKAADKLAFLNSQTTEISMARAQLVLAISCVGRRLVLGERAEDETEALVNSHTQSSTICGFYSYGELAPTNQGSFCDLHNQSMTLMGLYEVSKAS